MYCNNFTATYACEQDWKVFGKKCYYFGPIKTQTTKTWERARDYCASSGGNLVIIDDPYEMSFVTGNSQNDLFPALQNNLIFKKKLIKV